MQNSHQHVVNEIESGNSDTRDEELRDRNGNDGVDEKGSARSDSGVDAGRVRSDSGRVRGDTGVDSGRIRSKGDSGVDSERIRSRGGTGGDTRKKEKKPGKKIHDLSLFSLIFSSVFLGTFDGNTMEVPVQNQHQHVEKPRGTV